MAIPFDPRNKQQQRTGTGFTNIGRVMQANRPGQLGQALTSRVGGTIGQSQADLKKQRDEFDEKSKESALGTEEQRTQATAAIAGAGTGTPEEAASQQAIFDRTRAGYQGPQGLSNQAALQAQQAQLGAIGGATRTAGGRQALLQRYVGGPQYSQGQQRMDTLLLGGTNLRGLGRSAREAQQTLGQGQEQASLQAQNARAQADQFGRDIQSQLGTAGGEVDAAIAAREQQEETLKNRAATALQKLSRNEAIHDDEAQALQDMLRRQEYGQLAQSGIVGGLRKLGGEGINFVNTAAIDLDRGQYANAEQIARLNALQKLGGDRSVSKLTLPGQAVGGGRFSDLFDIGQLNQAAGAVSDEFSPQLREIEKRYGENTAAFNSKQAEGQKYRQQAATMQSKLDQLKQLQQKQNTDPRHMTPDEQIQLDSLTKQAPQIQAQMASVQDNAARLEQQATGMQGLRDQALKEREQALYNYGAAQTDEVDPTTGLRKYKFQSIQDLLNKARRTT